MSVIAGLIHNGITCVATDSQLNWGDNDCETRGHKFLSVPGDSFLIGAAGDDYLSQLVEEAIIENKIEPPKSKRDIRKLCIAIKVKFDEASVTRDPTSGVPIYDFELLVASSGKLFVVEANFCIYEASKYTAIGSGSTVVMSALDMFGGKAQPHHLKRAMAIATKRHAECGGKIHIRSI